MFRALNPTTVRRTKVFAASVLLLWRRFMREIIKLLSTAKTGHFYTTTKNKRKKPEKLEVKKYDPVVRKHVVYKETKI